MATTLIRLDQVHKHYGARAILDGADLALAEGQKVAVIGRNGAGKSTICRLILGEEQVDAGAVVRHDDLRLAHLEQRDPFVDGETVLDFLMRRSQQPDWRCGMVAGRFLLSQELLERPVSGLSGGWQTRVRLAAMLLAEPNFLILDEPTNYLDLKTLLLLEGFLRDFRGGFMVVSHDRAFLKATCTSTVEVARGRIVSYPGDVDAFRTWQAAQREQAEHHNANVALRRKELQAFVDRNRAKASKATQAQSKLKMLERLEEVEIDDDDRVVAMTIPPTEARTGTALLVDDLAIGYPDKTVARGIRLEIERGRHVAVLGDNGQGKTTLLRTLAGTLPALAGTVKWGHAVRIGYYAQHVFAAMDERLTVQSYLERTAAAAPGHTTTQQILDLAGAFLFRGGDVQKPISVLSGGERSRLCLAGLLLGRFPVLVMDEPTNHLDCETVEALADALAGYNGTIFFTSHDRTFAERLATAIIDVRDGTATLVPDGYDAYVYRLRQETAAADPQPAAKSKAGETRGGAPPDRRARQQRLAQARSEAQACERTVAALERERETLCARLAADPAAHARTAGARLQALTRELEAAEARWLELQAEIERG